MTVHTDTIPQEMATAWLERFDVRGSRPDQIALDDFPFTVGRSASCTLSLEPHRVSREHAVIELDADRYVVKDLGSTNGTFLNGQRIETAELSDGDLLVFADVDFAFHCPNRLPREAATEVFQATASSPSNEIGWELIREVRRLHEQTTQSASLTRFEEIVELHSLAPYGYHAIYERGCATPKAVDQLLQSTECRLLARFSQLARAVAVQNASQLPGAVHLFLPLESYEMGLEDLPASLHSLCQAATPGQELVVEIPQSAACNIPYFRDLLKSIRELGIAVAYTGFAGGHTQIQQFSDIAPDYLKLSKSVTEGIANNSHRQRQLQAVVQAAADLNCDLIAVELASSDAAEVCRDLGCRFAQGVVANGKC